MMETNRHILFGAMALEAELIDAAQFAEACRVWKSSKDVPLADLMLERGWITPTDRADVERLLEDKVKSSSGSNSSGIGEPRVGGEGPSPVSDPELMATLPLACPGGEPARPAEIVPVGTPAERYTLKKLHAIGATAQVWLARDDDMRRHVALKTLRPEVLDKRHVCARFLKEARITGQLQHPSIVPVYEMSAPIKDRLPFYTMRFIKGRTLREEAVAYHDRRAAGQSDPLELRILLNALIAVCNAVAYAHARGVIHRDLKGQNVVLGDFGEVMVVDWGLAKVLGRHDLEAETPADTARDAQGDEHTLHGQPIGTPGYMSPEQAAGKLDLIDQRSDVYGLGAILYEILTGSVPFTGTTTQEVLLKVRIVELVPPHQICPASRSLEAICLKAMAKEPANRYATATELKQEIQRWLADEPVEAYLEPVAMRACRWTRRHKPFAAGVSALMLTTLVALSISTALIGQERARTRAAFVSEADQHRLAEGRTHQARQAVDEMYTQVAEQWISQQPNLEPLQRNFLGKALKLYQEFARERSNDPGIRRDTGMAYDRVGEIQRKLGLYTEAQAAYRAASSIHQALAVAYPNIPRHRRDLAATYQNMSATFTSLGRTTESELFSRKSLDLLDRLGSDYPHDSEIRRELGGALNDLGDLCASQGRTEEAEQSFRRALELQAAPAAGLPAEPAYRRNVATIQRKLGAVLAGGGRRVVAEAAYQESAAMARALANEFPDVPDYHSLLASALHGEASLLGDRKEFPEARKLLEEAIHHQQAALAAANPRSSGCLRDLLGHHEELARASLGLGDHVEAARIAAAMPGLSPHPGPHEFEKAALILARCIPIVLRADEPCCELRQSQAESYAEEAVKLLRQALDGGFQEWEEFKNHLDLVPLRSREDFQRLSSVPG